MIIVTKKSITASISGALSMAYAHNGNPVVQVGPNTKVEWYSPAFQADANGSMLNIPGDNGKEIDKVNALADGPLKVSAGDVLSITKSDSNNTPRVANWPSTGYETRSRVQEAMAIAFVAYAPVEGQLFPSPIGKATNPIVSFLRSQPILPNLVDLSKLQSVYDLSKFTDMPGWALLERVFSDYWMEGYNGWNTDTSTPSAQHPGYGRDVASFVSQALIYLNSTDPIENKKKLALSMVEQGLALAGAFADGRVHQANGGHMQGRKALLVLAGHLLDIPPMEDPNWLGNIFQEGHMHRKEPGRTWWFGEWDVFWRRASEFIHPCDMPPSRWSPNEKWAFQGYYWHACGSNLGTAMAMNLMGLKKAMGSSFVEGIQQFMYGPPQSAKDELAQAGIEVPWGTDYPHPWNGKGFQQQVYEEYGI
jgi:hypothetical protein